MLMSLLFRNSILNYILYTRILVLLVALLMVLGSVWILIHTKVVVPIQSLGFVFILLLLAHDDKKKIAIKNIYFLIKNRVLDI